MTSVTSKQHQANWRQMETQDRAERGADRQKVGAVASNWSDRGRRGFAERRTEMDGGRATSV